MLKRIMDRVFGHRIYLDYASITPIDKRVKREIEEYSSSDYANPSSFYREGVRAKESLKDARTKIAGLISAHPDEIIFTGGGTESNNLAIIGTVEALREKGVGYEDMHVLASQIEHSSVRECLNYLNGKGVVTEMIPVDQNGLVVMEQLKKMIRPNTVIVSVMAVNNEIGSVQPVKEIAKIIRRLRSSVSAGSSFNFQDFNYPILHTDASQAFLYQELNTEKLGIDLLTLDGTKVYGPRGSGILFVKKGTPLVTIVHGGGQEKGLRSGTENFPAIMGLAKALKVAVLEREFETARIDALRKYFIDGLRNIRPDIKINGAPEGSNILNVLIPGIDNEFFVLQLDAKGICCSTKSSCLGDEDQSYVLHAIGSNSRESVRFSFGRWTTKADIRRTVRVMAECLSKK